jgi:hypothetical protein
MFVAAKNTTNAWTVLRTTINSRVVKPEGSNTPQWHLQSDDLVAVESDLDLNAKPQ